MDTRDLNRVWCVAAVLAFDPRLSGGPRWQRVKVKGKGDGDGDGACGASDGCKGSLSGSAEPRQSQTSIWGGDDVVCLDPLVLPSLFPLTSVALEGEAGAADV